MSWLRSPRKLIRTTILFIILTLLLLWFIPDYYNEPSVSVYDKHSDEISESESEDFSLDTLWNDANPWILNNSIYDTKDATFLDRLKSYTVAGHDFDTLSEGTQPSEHPITILLPLYSKDSLPKLDILLNWTSNAFELWVVCSSQLKGQIEERLSMVENQRIIVMDRTVTNSFTMGSAGASVWLQVLNQKINTEYIYVFDEDNNNYLPSNERELNYLLNVQKRDEYRNALIGSRGIVFSSPDIICVPFDSILPNLSQPSDMLVGSWLIHQSWLPFMTSDIQHLESLKLPLGYYISKNLNQQLGIPTVVLPYEARTVTDPMELDEIKLKIAEEDKETDRISKKLCEVTKDNWKADTHWRSLVAKNQLPSVLEYRDYRTPAALMVAHGSTQLIQLYPLICRFSQYILHLALVGNDISGENLQRVFKEADCPYHRNVRVHDYTELSIHLDEHIGKLMQSIKPRILIQVKPDHEEEKANLLYFALKAMGSTYQMTPIGLPLKDIVHSLWIPDLSLDSLQNWNKIDIKLVVITDRRPHSLSRLLQSSARSIYLGDNVDIMLHMEQSADRATRMLVNSFVWRQGQKMIRHRIRKGGLMPAIVESWYPSHNDEYAVLLEDDIEVSPLFYVWSKYAILKYRYGEDADIHRLMFGISLYAPRNLELIPAGRTTFDPNTVILPAGYPEHIPYVSQVPCSWGAVYFPEHWKEFHTYLVRRLADLNLPKDSRRRLISVPGSRSDKWKKSWKKYFIEMVYLRAYVMLYPNFENFEAFSTNHVEFGTHVKSEKRQSVIGTFMVPLMQRDTLLSQLPDHHLPTFDDLPVLDLWGQLQSHSLLETKASKYHAHVSTCPRTYGTFDPAEFFCPVKGPPDPPQLFPMSSKKGGKEPVLFKNVIQPIRYKYVTEFRKEEEENARNELVDFGPKPLDVAQLPLVEERFSNRDDEMYDLEGDLDTLNRLYYKMKPEDLDFLEDERLDMEEEEEEDDEEEIEEDD